MASQPLLKRIFKVTYQANNQQITKEVPATDKAEAIRFADAYAQSKGYAVVRVEPKS